MNQVMFPSSVGPLQQAADIQDHESFCTMPEYFVVGPLLQKLSLLSLAQTTVI